MCVKESMRMFAPVPNISRCAEKDILLPDGRLIPAGIVKKIVVGFLHWRFFWLFSVYLGLFW